MIPKQVSANCKIPLVVLKMRRWMENAGRLPNSSLCQPGRGERGASGRSWIVVKELSLNHSIGETLLFTIYT